MLEIYHFEEFLKQEQAATEALVEEANQRVEPPRAECQSANSEAANLIVQATHPSLGGRGSPDLKVATRPVSTLAAMSIAAARQCLAFAR